DVVEMQVEVLQKSDCPVASDVLYDLLFCGEEEVHFLCKEQENSAKLLVKNAKALNMMLPLFITGDFNAGPESGAYRIMTESFKDVNALTENDWTETYHGYYFEGEEPRHIDYFFIDGNFVPLSYRVIRETVDGKYPTDHYGLEIELELR
ncbi:MAG: hypothetical protein II780_05440, partial [Clostridia bacterium]|nr:hypothetical protein [Clostridia bacterium]